MEIRFKPETESRLNQLAARSGLATDDLVEDAMAAYLTEVEEIRNTLDRRYEEFKSGKAELIDGEAFLESLRRKTQKLLKQPEK